MSDKVTTPSGDDNTSAILTSLQQGVIAINSLTQAFQAIFPSSS